MTRKMQHAPEQEPSEANQNADTTRIFYANTKELKWNTFLENGRPEFQNYCLLLCDVKFVSGSCSFWEERPSIPPGKHAERKALRHIKTKEKQDGTAR